MSANDLEGDDIWGGDESKQNDEDATGNNNNNAENVEDEETRHMSVNELRQRIHLINNDIRVMKSDVQRITHESRGQRDRIRENQEKIKLNKQLPYLVANVVEILEPDAEDGTVMIAIVVLVAWLLSWYFIASTYSMAHQPLFIPCIFHRRSR
jgi:ATP-dependent 26S proteasome regulatory subunit